MDNRKLKYAGHTTVWDFEGKPENHAEIRDEDDNTIAFVTDPNTDLEIVRRWNAFPALFEALELLSGDTVQQAGHFDLAQKSARALLQSLKA